MDGVARALSLAFQLFDAGRRVEAASVCQSVLALAPHHPDALHLQGALAHVGGEPQRAIGPILRSVALAPGRAIVHNTLGCAELAIGRPVLAAASLSRALALKPDLAEAASNLGIARKQLGDPDGALEACRRAVALAPDHVSARVNLGAVLEERGDYQEAAAEFRRAIGLDPASAAAAFNLGRALVPQGRLGEAAASNARALALDPSHAEAHLNLGTAKFSIGALDEAIACVRNVLSLKPDDAPAHSNLLFMMLSHPDVGPDALFAEARRWEDRHARPLYRLWRPHDNDRDPERPLRIGYLSADLRQHAVTNNIDGLYTKLDATEFRLYGYAEVAQPDAVTETFRRRAEGWRFIVGLGDEAVAEAIRADRIDILVCMAGHTAGNRLRICALKPAPIQVSFGDLTTTGLEAMDYWVSDPIVHPLDTTERFTETLLRLPSFETHRPPAGAPDPGRPPSLDKGYVTFRSCSNLSKINPSVVALWARVLHAVPGARLLLKYVNRFADPAVRGRFAELFASHGIGADRLDFRFEVQARVHHLGVLHDIDIGLDPFPFNGCTTTFEALWMGVPVVTLSGQRFVGRVGEGILRRVDLGDLVARDGDEYVRIAAALAADSGRLAELRGSLRPRTAASALCDHEGLARATGQAFRRIWRDWCRRQAA